MPRNIFAYTAPGADFPGYVSVNQVDDKTPVIVRSTKELGGNTAQIDLTIDQARELGRALTAL